MSLTTVEEKKQAQRQAIMEIAKEHFERFGYKRAVIDDIVREVGIAKGTFYLYFKSKDQLLFDLIDQSRHEVLEKFLAAIQEEKTAAGQVRIIIEMSFQAFEDYPLLARLLAEDPEFRIVTKMLEQPAAQEEMRQAIASVQALLRTGRDSGELREDLNLEIVPLVIGMLKFLHYYTGFLDKHGVTRKQFIDNLVDLVLKGLLRR